MAGTDTFLSGPITPFSPLPSPEKDRSPSRSRSPRRQAQRQSDNSAEPPKVVPEVARLLADAPVSAALICARAKTWEGVKDVPRIPELDYVPAGKFMEATKETVLNPLIEAHDCIMVAGGFFGDEGKGKTVDAIATHPKVQIVARVNSGENAGHTVIGPTGIKYDFHLCPSGLLTPGKVNVVGPECVMDPVSFMQREVSQLLRDGVEYKDRLFVGNAHLVCPHHKLLDLMASWKSPNMSTLQGMGPVHASKAKRIGLRMDHLFNDRADAKRRLEKDLVEYWGYLKNLGITEKQLYEKASANSRIQKHVLDFVEAQDKSEYLFELYDKHVVNNPQFPTRADVSHMLRQALSKGQKVLLEGPQSFWLSNAGEKFWDSGTSAQTCASGMLAASRLNLSGLRTLVINIHKTPGSSRVGSGANPVAFAPMDFFSKTDATKDHFEKMEIDWRRVGREFFGQVQPNGIVKPGLHTTPAGCFDLGVAMAAATCIHPSHLEFGVTSGRPRVVGFFDCVAQAEAMAAQGPYVSISAFDRADDYEQVGLCIAYVYHHPEGLTLYSNGRKFTNGTIIKTGEALPTQQVLEHCHPILKLLPGWPGTPLFARSAWWSGRAAPVQLPQAVSDMLDAIEHYTGSKVLSIGNGPRGSDIIYVQRIE